MKKKVGRKSLTPAQLAALSEKKRKLVVYQQKWYQANKDRIRARREKSAKEFPTLNRERCRRWRENERLKLGYCPVAEGVRNWRDAIKLELFVLLGDKCDGCPWNITDHDMLSVHHINGNGKLARRTKAGKKTAGSMNWLRYMREYESDPTSLRLLCRNCHAKLEANEHRERRQQYRESYARRARPGPDAGGSG